MNDLKLNQNTRKSDVLGAAVSGIYLIHCLATPFLFVAQSGVTTPHKKSPVWRGLIDMIWLMVSRVAAYWAAKKNSRKWMKIALPASWAFLAIIILNEKFEGFHIAETWIYVPTVSLVILHLYNMKYCQCQDETCCTISEEKSI